MNVINALRFAHMTVCHQVFDNWPAESYDDVPGLTRKVQEHVCKCVYFGKKARYAIQRKDKEAMQIQLKAFMLLAKEADSPNTLDFPESLSRKCFMLAYDLVKFMENSSSFDLPTYCREDILYASLDL